MDRQTSTQVVDIRHSSRDINVKFMYEAIQTGNILKLLLSAVCPGKPRPRREEACWLAVFHNGSAYDWLAFAGGRVVVKTPWIVN